MERPGPATHTLGLLLLVVAVATGGHGTPRDTLACSQVGWRRGHAGPRGVPAPASRLPPRRASPAASSVSASGRGPAG